MCCETIGMSLLMRVHLSPHCTAATPASLATRAAVWIAASLHCRPFTLSTTVRTTSSPAAVWVAAVLVQEEAAAVLVESAQNERSALRAAGDVVVAAEVPMTPSLGRRVAQMSPPKHPVLPVKP